MEYRYLLEILADGQLHSLANLAARLKAEQRQIQELVQELETFGIKFSVKTEKAYQIAEPIEFLDAARILSFLPDSLKPFLSELEILESIDSTNRYLMQKALKETSSGVVCLAEYQTAGKGRLGKPWFSSYGQNIAMSLLWQFPKGLASLSGLSLVVGIAVAQALSIFGVKDIGLKWPNDVMLAGKKLAGILIELAGNQKGTASAVIGIGMNVKMPQDMEPLINQPWTDIASQLQKSFSRNHLVSVILQQLLMLLPIFAEQGFEPFIQTWNTFDILQGQAVTVSSPAESFKGVAHGIDVNGNILVNDKETVKSFSYGEVSIRKIKVA